MMCVSCYVGVHFGIGMKGLDIPNVLSGGAVKAVLVGPSSLLRPSLLPSSLHTTPLTLPSGGGKPSSGTSSPPSCSSSPWPFSSYESPPRAQSDGPSTPSCSPPSPPPSTSSSTLSSNAGPCRTSGNALDLMKVRRGRVIQRIVY